MINYEAALLTVLIDFPVTFFFSDNLMSLHKTNYEMYARGGSSGVFICNYP